MPSEIVLGTAVRFTSAPLMEYSAMYAAPPMRIVTPRDSHSMNLSSRASMMALSPYSLVTTIGEPRTPMTLKVSICNSGKARPMPSASITGRPVSAPTTSGIVELMPPHSIGIVANALRPR